MRRLAALVLMVTAPAVTAGEGDWPAFRGGDRAGVAEAKSLPDAWGPDRNVVWKADVPGLGWSSPVVWGGRVFVTSAASAEKPPEARKGLYIQDLAGKLPPGEHRWLVHCLDFKTGKPLWTQEAHKGPAPGTLHIKNTFASATPVVDGERLYVLFGNVGLFCYTLDGKPLWSHRFEPVKTRMGWGPGASPAAHGGKVFVVNDNEEKSTLTCFDGASGRPLWQVERDEKSNWVTPFVWRHEGRTEIVTAGSKKVRSYGLDGKLLWELEGMSVLAIPTPFAADGLLYVSSGYVGDPRRRPVYAVRPGAEGDVSLKGDETSNKFVAWSQKLAGPYHPTPLVYGDYLYVLLDRGFLSCYGAKTGKVVYERQKIEGGDVFTASPWAYGGKVFCLSEDGDTFVIKAGPKFEQAGKNALDEMSLATPALAHGSLLLRTQTRLYRLAKSE
jgi:outer membrane protein assembly factor BamB